MTVWVTKYALTKGILEVEAKVTLLASMIEYRKQQYAHGEGKDWHRSADSAIERAERMRAARIGALKRQIASLEDLVFEIQREK